MRIIVRNNCFIIIVICYYGKYKFFDMRLYL